jgi:acetolactate synthase I/II/III large subunit
VWPKRINGLRLGIGARLGGVIWRWRINALRVFDAVAAILKAEGTDYLFNFPTTPLIDAATAAGIRPLVCRQERVGIGMADGYSRTSGGRKIGVFAMQAGPGSENGFPGVATAFADSSPILVLPLGPPRDRAQVFPYFNSSRAFETVSKHFETLTLPNQVSEVMRRAFGQLRSGRPGPVMVEIPIDVGELDDEGAGSAYRAVRGARSAGDPADVERAATDLLAASHPLIYAGQGVLYAEAWEELRQLAELLGAPVATSLEGKSVFPENHPLALGTGSIAVTGPVLHFMQKADVVLAIGCSLTRGETLTANIPPNKKIIHSTNDPRDLNKGYFVDNPILGDAKLVLSQLNNAIQDQLGHAAARSSEELIAEIAAVKTTWLEQWMPKLTSNKSPINPYRVIWEFMQFVDPARAIVTHDSGSPRDQIVPFYVATAPHGYIGWGKSHALGTGVGLTMGAKLAAPEMLCAHFMGDAAFGMTGLDLETAARLAIPTLSIVLKNSTMAIEIPTLVISHERFATRDLGGDYCQAAKALGVSAESVEHPSDIRPALERARRVLDSGAPALIQVITSAEHSTSLKWALSSYS